MLATLQINTYVPAVIDCQPYNMYICILAPEAFNLNASPPGSIPFYIPCQISCVLDPTIPKLDVQDARSGSVYKGNEMEEGVGTMGRWQRATQDNDRKREFRQEVGQEIAFAGTAYQLALHLHDMFSLGQLSLEKDDLLELRPNRGQREVGCACQAHNLSLEQD